MYISGRKRRSAPALAKTIVLSLSAAMATTPAWAQETYKVGAALSLSGYLAFIDRPFKDGIELAAEAINAAGGIKGQKVEVIVEDMRSEPVDTVTTVKKLIASQKVDVLINGCSSAGNAAALPIAGRAETPMMMCSVLPPNPKLQTWGFSMLAAPSAEVAPRIEYLAKTAKVERIGILYDPTPYARLQKEAAEKLAGEHGLKIVAIERYKTDDADMTAYITKLTAAGAQAVLKMGAGPSTITTAKAVKQLGLQVPLLTSVEDLAVLRVAGKVLGEQFFFVAHPAQVFDALPADAPERAAVGRFISLWQKQHGDRDPSWASRGWDALQIVKAAVERVGSTDGDKVRDAIESTTAFRGASAEFTYSASSHYGVRKNPWYLAQIIEGKSVIVQ